MPTRNEQIAQLAMLSGDEQLARFGQVLLDDEQRRQILSQRQAEFDHQRRQPTHLGQGFLYDPESKQTTQVPGYADFEERKHQQALEMFDAQQRAQYRRDQRITGTELVNLADLDSQLQLGRDALVQLHENPETVEPIADMATNVAKSVWPDMGNLIESAHKSETELDTLNKMRRFIAGIRKSELGSALTGYELTKGAEWDPTAGGIDSGEAARRLTNLLQYLEQEYETMRAGRPLPSGRSAATPPQQQTAAPPQQEWIIGEDGKPVRIR